MRRGKVLPLAIPQAVGDSKRIAEPEVLEKEDEATYKDELLVVTPNNSVERLGEENNSGTQNIRLKREDLSNEKEKVEAPKTDIVGAFVSKAIEKLK